MNYELTTTSILSLFETNKEQRQSFIIATMQAIEDGEVDPLKVHYQLKCIEKIIFEMTSTDETKNKDGFNIAKRYRELLMDAVEKYGQKKFKFLNSEVEIKEAGVKYDYSKCNDSEINSLLEDAETIAIKLKERQKFLQTVPSKGLELVDSISGELTTIYPPSKSSTTTIQVTLK